MQISTLPLATPVNDFNSYKQIKVESEVKNPILTSLFNNKTKKNVPASTTAASILDDNGNIPDIDTSE